MTQIKLLYAIAYITLGKLIVASSLTLNAVDRHQLSD